MPQIVFDFGKGALGRTFLLRADHLGIAHLHAVMTGLVTGSATVIHLSKDPCVRIEPGTPPLELRLADTMPDSQRVRLGATGTLMWFGTHEDWITTLELIEPLRRDIGYQILSASPLDDAIIEIWVEDSRSHT
ncbi:MAG TPA: hypothetical protein VFQ85_03150 [Mycobacteriales bacterium]|jgi:hypothetical protein|nr:hypothetical protein [Mycobacteriales bacterium]